MPDETKNGSAPKESAPPEAERVQTKPAEARPPEAKPTKAKAAAAAPRPMGRLAARVAFYLGILAIIGCILVKFIFPGSVAVGPRAFGGAAALWLLISMTILLAEIERKISER